MESHGEVMEEEVETEEDQEDQDVDIEGIDLEYNPDFNIEYRVDRERDCNNIKYNIKYIFTQFVFLYLGRFGRT